MLIKLSSDAFPVQAITTDRVAYLESLQQICLSLPLHSAIFILVIPLQVFEPTAEIIHLLCFKS